MSDSEKATIIWNEYNNQNEWQRHNENQRAQLSTVLLLLAGAVITFMPKDLKPNDWPMPVFLVLIGVVGLLAVMKYWERFEYHLDVEEAYRKVLDVYLAEEFGRARKEGINSHNARSRPLLKDEYSQQHWLWEVVFALIAALGVVLTITALQV